MQNNGLNSSGCVALNQGRTAASPVQQNKNFITGGVLGATGREICGGSITHNISMGSEILT